MLTHIRCSNVILYLFENIASNSFNWTSIPAAKNKKTWLRNLQHFIKNLNMLSKYIYIIQSVTDIITYIAPKRLHKSALIMKLA